jgi:hypothetical protein
MFNVPGPSTRIHRQLDGAHGLKRVQQLVDGGFAQLGIGGVRHAARRSTSYRSAPLDPSASRFSVGSPLIRKREPRGFCGGMVRPALLLLLAHHEQQPEVRVPAFQQAFGGFDHGGDDALGVARAAAPDELIVLTRGKNGGTVSRCVESVTMGVSQQANTLNRPGSTSIRSVSAPLLSPEVRINQLTATGLTACQKHAFRNELEGG